VTESSSQTSTKPLAHSPARLQALDVNKQFEGLAVLTGLELDVAPGESLSILGPSGCGKTTLLRLLAGFDQPTGGQILVDGVEVDGPSPKRGMVAQAGVLFPWLTVRSNLAWGPKAAGRSDFRSIAERLIDEMGLSGFGDCLPRQLSGGMRQRASIAQVLANMPPVLLLDEPFAGLDAQTRLRMQAWLRRLLQATPTTVVLVTHDVEESLLLGDRVAVLSPRPGQVVTSMDVVLDGPRDQAILTDNAFVDLKRRALECLQ